LGSAITAASCRSAWQISPKAYHLIDHRAEVEEFDEKVDAWPAHHVVVESIGDLVAQGREAAADQLDVIFDLVDAVRVMIGQQKMKMHEPITRGSEGAVAAAGPANRIGPLPRPTIGRKPEKSARP